MMNHLPAERAGHLVLKIKKLGRGNSNPKIVFAQIRDFVMCLPIFFIRLIGGG